MRYESKGNICCGLRREKKGVKIEEVKGTEEKRIRLPYGKSAIIIRN